jgi:parallel beta-helix repeat protein
MRTLGLPLIFILMTMICLPFMVQPSIASSTIYIRADGSIDPDTAPISTVDKITYTFTGNVDDEIVVEKANTIIDCNGHIVEGSGTGKGFTLYNVANVTIRNANIRNFTYGIYLESASYNFIHGNNISANSYDGIEIYFSSDNNEIADNNIETSEWFGIGIYYSNNNTIKGNKIINNNDGIWLYDALDNTISMNDISANSEYGIELYYASNNMIFHNNFMGNLDHIYAEYSINNWDNGYPSGGNYWDDYSGVDAGGDGIGDTPYVIDENNQDRYPLMKPWTNIAILDISPSKTVVGKGFTLYIYVSVQNQGFSTETLNVTAYANTTIIDTSVNVTLTSRNSITITFTWNTTDVAKGNYTISAYATPVDGETDTTDNTKEDGMVLVTIPGDVNGDRKVSVADLVRTVNAVPSTPTINPEKWDPNADINCDDKVSMSDVVLCVNYIPSGPWHDC